MFQGASDIVSNSMKLFREQEVLLGCFSVLLLLSGCGGAEPECDSLDTRNSVVKIVSDDSNNALVNYAVKNSDAVAAFQSVYFYFELTTNTDIGTPMRISGVTSLRLKKLC
jgi:hypothetical protein